jgi:hypothetical protein
MTSSQTAPKHSAEADRRRVLSTLWTFLVLSFLYADVFTLFFDKGLKEQPIALNSGAILFFAVVMEAAIAAVLLSRILPYAWNRRTNIGVAVLQLAVLVYSVTEGAVTSFYAFFAAIEIAVLVFIIGYAWTWRQQPRLDSVAVPAGA